MIFVIFILILGWVVYSIYFYSYYIVVREQKLQEYEEKLDKALRFSESIDIEKIRRNLDVLRRELKVNKIKLKDKMGMDVNICPKCGGTMRIVQNRWGKDFLGCSNYPECSYYRSFKRIYGIKIE